MLQQELANFQSKITDKVAATVIQTQPVLSSSVNVNHDKRKLNSASAQPTVPITLTTVQSYTRPLTATSLSHPTTSSPTTTNTKSVNQTTASNRSISQTTTSSGRVVTHRNMSPKKESPRKLGRGAVTLSNENSGKLGSARNRKQTLYSSSAVNTTSGTRSKKEKLLCICRTPYDDTK